MMAVAERRSGFLRRESSALLVEKMSKTESFAVLAL